MMRIIMFFRLVALAALLLGLANLLLGFAPRWATDTHALLGILAVLSAWGVVWPQRSTAIGRVGASLAASMLVLGLGLWLRWWGGLGIGLTHLAVGLGMIALVEMSAARQRRMNSQRR